MALELAGGPVEGLIDPASVGFSAPRLSRLTAALNDLVEGGRVPGLVALVARHGRLAYFESFGRRDLEAGDPMPRNAIFRLYSMTKPITATAVMMLYEEGQFQLDDSISRFIPEFAATRVFDGATEPAKDDAGVPDGWLPTLPLDRPITIRHLLTHTSGIPYGDFTGGPTEQLSARERIQRRDEPLAEKIARLAGLPLAHQPGAAWTYGLSIDVLGRLIEVVAGQPLDVFLRRRLFDPLGMVDTGFAVPADSRGRLGAAYSPRRDGTLERLRMQDTLYAQPPAYLSGGAGLVGTALDYARFAQMLANGGTLAGVRLLSPKTVSLFAASQTPRPSLPIFPTGWPFREGYGMALGVRTLVDVARSGMLGSVGSFTWQGAASTDFWVDPVEGIVGVLMLQLLPGYFRPGELMRVLTYQALVD